mmetsp:Transcript_31062/g.95967  ORF Transcript_31062/g.95967 Transcript_31062/m.95967 type:complete len:263 (-) Transcript_31062:687-1475(-)
MRAIGSAPRRVAEAIAEPEKELGTVAGDERVKPVVAPPTDGLHSHVWPRNVTRFHDDAGTSRDDARCLVAIFELQLQTESPHDVAREGDDDPFAALDDGGCRCQGQRGGFSCRFASDRLGLSGCRGTDRANLRTQIRDRWPVGRIVTEGIAELHRRLTRQAGVDDGAFPHELGHGPREGCGAHRGCRRRFRMVSAVHRDRRGACGLRSHTATNLVDAVTVRGGHKFSRQDVAGRVRETRTKEHTGVREVHGVWVAVQRVEVG